MTETAPNGVSAKHPHEPEVPPTLDDEGRCLVCKALVAAEGLGYMRAQTTPMWLLTGDLGSLEFAIAEYVCKYGQHLPGVHPERHAGVPTAVANMAMSVIRRHVRGIAAP